MFDYEKLLNMSIVELVAWLQSGVLTIAEEQEIKGVINSRKQELR